MFNNKKYTDMRFYDYTKNKLPFLLALGIGFIMLSCGSYQYVGYSSDGIYSDEDTIVYEETSSTDVEPNATSANSYYRHYFNEKANQYSDLTEDEDVIFTDIDAYEGEYDEENQNENRQSGYAGWGQTNDNVTIYINDTWGYNNPWLWNSYYWNRPWGWNRWGWNRWGWNNWGWNTGFGWGWNTGFGWGWNYGIGWGFHPGCGFNGVCWYPPGYGYVYNGYYYNRPYYSYNNGRRGANTTFNTRSTTTRNAYTRRSRSNLSNRFNSSVRRNTSIRRNSSTIRRGTNTTRSNSSIRPGSSTRRNTNISRPRNNSRSRSNMSTSRRSGSSSVRSSSGSSVRSSGSSRSSSSRSSGRSGTSRRR